MPSTFPTIESLTEDQRWETMLDVMRVPGWSNVFVLGSFARYVTIYSQQIRALNLVDALWKSGRLYADSRVAVLGAGIAGLTATAALAQLGAHVTLYERTAGPDRPKGRLPLQNSSTQRFVHPHIYDWPYSTTRGDRTDLPLLNWTAASADRVAQEIDEQFRGIVAKVGDRVELTTRPLTPHRRQRTVNVEDGAPILYPWGVKSRRLFDVIVLAVGFGVEPNSYWSDDGIDGGPAPEGSWFVSGSGDGGLTDLMRLCLPNFKHDKYLRAFLNAIPDRLAEDARALEGGSDDLLGEGYERLGRDLLARLVPESDIRELRGTNIRINAGLTELFGRGSSVLNRVITAYLLAIDAFHLSDGVRRTRLQRPVTRHGHESRVHFADGGSETFAGVVIRHGPTSALTHTFPEVAERCAPLASAWKTLAQKHDWTRTIMFDGNDFESDAPRLRPRPGRAHAPIVLGEGDGLDGLENATSMAIRRIQTWDEITAWRGHPLDSDVHAIRSTDVVSKPARYADVLRRLVESSILVVDVGTLREHTVIPLLLGIRAVARRSLTIATTAAGIDERTWDTLPFNLQELNLVPGYGARPQEDFIKRLKATLLEGFSLADALGADYLDLPVFNAVRRLGTVPSSFAPIPPDEQILLLCSFDQKYLAEAGNFIETELNTLAGGKKAVRIVDSPSPLLTSERLYAAIRRSMLTVVDLTGWSPNVMFELGVRLACNPIEPIVLLEQPEHPTELSAQQHGIIEILRPFHYRLDPSGRKDLTKHLRHEYARVAVGDLRHERSPRISAGLTYRTIRDGAEIDSRTASEAVNDILISTSHQTLGPDLRRHGTLPILFADHPGLSARAFDEGVEGLIAVWYYLDGRHQLVSQPKNRQPSLVQQFVNIGEKIYALLSEETRVDYKKICTQIAKSLETIYCEIDHFHGELVEDRAVRDKHRARRLRNNHPNRSLALLEATVERLEQEIQALNSTRDSRHPGQREKSLAGLLAECHAMLAGIHRHMGAYSEAWAHYDEAYEYERKPEYGNTNSYAMVQRLVARILDNPTRAARKTWSKKPVAFPRDLEQALEQVRLQIQRGRSNDPWAHADIALLSILRVDDQGADWNSLTKLLAPGGTNFVTASLVATLEELIHRLEDAYPDSKRPARIATLLTRLHEGRERLLDQAEAIGPTY